MTTFCPFCGAELPDGARYCDQCGTKLDSVSATSAAPTPDQRGSRNWLWIGGCGGLAVVTLLACIVAVLTGAEIFDRIDAMLLDVPSTPFPVHDPLTPAGPATAPGAPSGSNSDWINQAMDDYDRLLIDAGLDRIAADLALLDYRSCLDREAWVSSQPEGARGNCRYLVALGEFEIDDAERELAGPGLLANSAALWFQRDGGWVAGLLRYDLEVDLYDYHYHMTGERRADYVGCVLTRRLGGEIHGHFDADRYSLTGWVATAPETYSLDGQCPGFSEYLGLIMAADFTDQQELEGSSTWSAYVDVPEMSGDWFGVGAAVDLSYHTHDLQRLKAPLVIVLD